MMPDINSVKWRHRPAIHLDWRRQRELRARRVTAIDGSCEVSKGDLVRIVGDPHPIGRALHDAGPGERVEIVGVDIVTHELPPPDCVHSWVVYHLADAP